MQIFPWPTGQQCTQERNDAPDEYRGDKAQSSVPFVRRLGEFEDSESSHPVRFESPSDLAQRPLALGDVPYPEGHGGDVVRAGIDQVLHVPGIADGQGDDIVERLGRYLLTAVFDHIGAGVDSQYLRCRRAAFDAPSGASRGVGSLPPEQDRHLRGSRRHVQNPDPIS